MVEGDPTGQGPVYNPNLMAHQMTGFSSERLELLGVEFHLRRMVVKISNCADLLAEEQDVFLVQVQSNVRPYGQRD